MAADTVYYHAHDLDVSSLQNLAKDLSKHLKVNVRYGFFGHPAEMLPLYDATLKPDNDDSIFITLGTVKQPNATATIILHEDDFLEKQCYAKYGDDLIYTKEVQEAYHIGDAAFNYDWLLKTYKEKADQVYFSAEWEEPSPYGSLVIYQHFVWNMAFWYRSWYNLCRAVMGEMYDTVTDQVDLFAHRYNVWRLAIALGADRILLLEENSDKYDGITQGDEWPKTWEDLESIVSHSTGDKLIPLASNTIEKVPIRPTYIHEVWDDYMPAIDARDRGEITEEEMHERMNVANAKLEGDEPDKYPLAFIDDFSDLQSLHDRVKLEYLHISMDEDPGTWLYNHVWKKELPEQFVLLIWLVVHAEPKVRSLSEDAQLGLYHILACSFVRAAYHNEAVKYHRQFLADAVWRTNNKKYAEDYLLLVFAQNDSAFIEELLRTYSFIETEFNEAYRTYFVMVLHPNTNKDEFGYHELAMHGYAFRMYNMLALFETELDD